MFALAVEDLAVVLKTFDVTIYDLRYEQHRSVVVADHH